MKLEKEGSMDPFSLMGLWRILKARYWILVLFLGIGSLTAYGLLDGFGNEEKNVAEWKRDRGVFWVGRFTKGGEKGRLMLHRLEKLFEEKYSPDVVGEPVLALEELNEFQVEVGGSSAFSVYMELDDSLAERSLLTDLRAALKGKGMVGKGESDPSFGEVSFELLHSSGARPIGGEKRGSSSRLRIRAYMVILILSLFLGFLVAIAVDRWVSGSE